MTASALLLAATMCFSSDPITPAIERAWRNALERSLELYRKNHEEYERKTAKDAAEARTRSQVRRSHRLPGLARANSVNALDIASAAIDTDVEGAQAGGTVAPYLLAG